MTTFLEELAAHRATLHRDFVPRVEAAKFIARMEQEHPLALEQWLRASAEVFVADALNNILRRERALVLRRAEARAFAIAAADAEKNGNMDGLRAFDIVYTIDQANTRRKVGDMTGADHLYVSTGYGVTGKRALMRAEFHRIIARKVGEQRTADVIPEEIYMKMLGSILRDEIAQARAA